MSVTETYRLVHSARGKLTREAQRSEHDLRLLVGHANLLDSLMIELEHAENQHTWSNAPAPKVTWATTTIEETEDESSDADSDDSDYDEDDMVMLPARVHGSPEYRPRIQTDSDSDDAISDSDEEEDEEDMSDDEDANNLGLALCRTNSHHETRSSSPPELVHDSDDSDDDTPPSPPATTINYVAPSPQEFAHLSTIRSKPRPEDALYEDGFYIPQTPMVAAC